VACALACGCDGRSGTLALDGSAVDAARDDAASPRDAALDAAASGSDDCERVVQTILLTCGSIVCHDPFSGGIGLELDLSSSADVPASLVGQLSTANCGSVPYIDTEQPEQSLLLKKIEDTPPCGDRMPAGDRPPLDGVQRDCFTRWVLDAAAQMPGDGAR
jgi:hypothetical protein